MVTSKGTHPVLPDFGNQMNKLTVSTRLIALIGLLSTRLVVTGVLGIFAVGRSNDALRSVHETRLLGMRTLGTIESLLSPHRLTLSLAFATPTPELIKCHLRVLCRTAP